MRLARMNRSSVQRSTAQRRGRPAHQIALLLGARLGGEVGKQLHCSAIVS